MQILNVSISGGLNLELTPSIAALSTNVPIIVEGNTFTITFTTNRPGIYPYTITGVSSADIGNASLTGSFTSNAETRTYTVTDDAVTEGRETFSIALDNGQSFATVGIDDAYYTLTANVASVNEDNVFSVTFNTNAIHALPLGYNITGGVSSSDFVGSPSLTGNFTSNGQVLTYTANSDLILEGTEYFAISLNNGRANANVIINDTSVAYYTLTANRASVNEGNSFTVTFVTNAIGQLPLGYTITGVSNIDFNGSPSLTGNFTSNGQVLTYTANSDLATDGVEYFAISLNNGRANANVIINDTSLTPPGQIEYTIPGTYSWVAPAGVSNISVLAVGAGGGGYQGGPGRYSGGGGGGGALVWVNNVAVTSGTTYSINVGAGAPANNPSTPGGTSWFDNSGHIRATGGNSGKDQVIPQAGGGFAINPSSYPGGGGNGGSSGAYAGDYSGTGGGGAGGYNGNGGTGSQGAYGFSVNSTAGSGGGGGGGGASTTARWGSAGGGVGLYGQGTSGSAGGAGTGGNGGSGGGKGEDGPGALGGSFGGGGGGGTQNSGSYVGGAGANGAVRLMWSGYNPTFLYRAYPSTNTANV
jgi:hypothetical protein